MARLDGNEIGKRIAEARRMAGGMGQRELAELIGVTERSVSAYENGEVIPFRFMSRIAEVTGVSVAWLYHGEDAIPDQGSLENQETIIAKLDEILALLKKRR